MDSSSSSVLYSYVFVTIGVNISSLKEIILSLRWLFPMKGYITESQKPIQMTVWMQQQVTVSTTLATTLQTLRAGISLQSLFNI